MYNTLTELEEKQFKFLKDTLLHFNSTNRGVVEGECSYVGGCAIGRHCDENLNLKLELTGGIADIADFGKGRNSDTTFVQLPSWMKELQQWFMARIQSLHDGIDNWNEHGYCGGLNYLLDHFAVDSPAMDEAITKFYNETYVVGHLVD